MNLGEAARAAAREILVHKVRSLLSFSALSVGAASLLYTMAQTKGMQEAMERNLELMGPGPLSVDTREGYVSKGLSRGLVSGDAEAIRAQLPELYMVSPMARARWGIPVQFEGWSYSGVSVLGATPEWAKRNWVYTLQGRFLSWRDHEEAARVCVVVVPPGWVKKPIWARFWKREHKFEDVLVRRELNVKRLNINGRSFLVVGSIMGPPRDKDPRWDSWRDPHVLVPLSSAQVHLGGRRDVLDLIEIDTGDERTIAPAMRKISALMKARHRGEEDFSVKNRREDLEGEIKEQAQYVVIGLTLGIVALLSGGIGILNVTLAAVYSRVREIGIRRALGAERADIVALFLSEAVLLGLAGGAAGVALGAFGVDKLAKAADRDVIELTWVHAASMIALSAAVAAAFAAFPAWRASRLDPVEALREEP